jgi:2-iminobutanoate/2-iminopropanoate deaminase
MALTMVHTDRAPAAIGPYSQAVRVAEWLFVSGQIGLVPETGQLVGDGLREQATQALQNLRMILEEVGFGLVNVVSVDVFLVDIAEFATFNGIYEAFFGSHKPARAVVEVRGLPRGALVEIKCVSWKLET